MQAISITIQINFVYLLILGTYKNTFAKNLELCKCLTELQFWAKIFRSFVYDVGIELTLQTESR